MRSLEDASEIENANRLMERNALAPYCMLARSAVEMDEF
jgi:hypothetical protein